jgi:hypothetical protein
MFDQTSASRFNDLFPQMFCDAQTESATRHLGDHGGESGYELHAHA